MIKKSQFKQLRKQILSNLESNSIKAKVIGDLINLEEIEDSVYANIIKKKKLSSLNTLDIYEICSFEDKKVDHFLKSIYIDCKVEEKYLMATSANINSIELFYNKAPCKKIAEYIIEHNEWLEEYPIIDVDYESTKMHLECVKNFTTYDKKKKIYIFNKSYSRMECQIRMTVYNTPVMFLENSYEGMMTPKDFNIIKIKGMMANTYKITHYAQLINANMNLEMGYVGITDRENLSELYFAYISMHYFQKYIYNLNLYDFVYIFKLFSLNSISIIRELCRPTNAFKKDLIPKIIYLVERDFDILYYADFVTLDLIRFCLIYFNNITIRLVNMFFNYFLKDSSLIHERVSKLKENTEFVQYMMLLDHENVYYLDEELKEQYKGTNLRATTMFKSDTIRNARKVLGNLFIRYSPYQSVINRIISYINFYYTLSLINKKKGYKNIQVWSMLSNYDMNFKRYTEIPRKYVMIDNLEYIVMYEE